MHDPNLFIDIVKYAGFPGILFIIFYIYHKAESEKWTQIISNQNQDSERIYDLLKSTMDRQSQEEEKRFLLLQELTESVQFLGVSLSRVETKIDTNQFCPITKNQKGQQ